MASFREIVNILRSVSSLYRGVTSPSPTRDGRHPPEQIAHLQKLREDVEIIEDVFARPWFVFMFAVYAAYSIWCAQFIGFYSSLSYFALLVTLIGGWKAIPVRSPKYAELAFWASVMLFAYSTLKLGALLLIQASLEDGERYEIMCKYMDLYSWKIAYTHDDLLQFNAVFTRHCFMGMFMLCCDTFVAAIFTYLLAVYSALAEQRI